MTQAIRHELETALEPFGRFAPVSVSVLQRSAGVLHVSASAGSVLLIHRSKVDVRGMTAQDAVGMLLRWDADRLIELFQRGLERCGSTSPQTNEHPSAQLQKVRAYRESGLTQ